MDTHRDPTTGYRAVPHAGSHPGPQAGSHAEIGRVLAHPEQRRVEVDRLHREISEDAQALAQAVAASPEGRARNGASSVYSIPDAATELG